MKTNKNNVLSVLGLGLFFLVVDVTATKSAEPSCKTTIDCATEMVKIAIELKEQNQTLRDRVRVLEEKVNEVQSDLQASINANKVLIEAQTAKISGLGIEYTCNFAHVAEPQIKSNNQACTTSNAHQPVQGFQIRITGNN